MGYEVCIYFLPFRRLPFQFADEFLCKRFCIWCNTSFFFFSLLFGFKKLIAKTNIKVLTPYVFFWEFYNFKFSIQVFILFWVDFCVWYKKKFQSHSFIAWYLIFTEVFTEETIFPHYMFLALLSKFIYAGVYFWALNSVTSVYGFMFMPLQLCWLL